MRYRRCGQKGMMNAGGPDKTDKKTADSEGLPFLYAGCVFC
jgi:hypothetical protein